MKASSSPSIPLSFFSSPRLLVLVLSFVFLLSLPSLSSASLPDWYVTDLDENSLGLDTNDNSTDLFDTNDNSTDIYDTDNGTDTNWDNSTDRWDTNVDDCDEVCTPGTYHDGTDMCMCLLESSFTFEEKE